LRRARSERGGTIAFFLAFGANRQMCRVATTFSTEEQAFSYLHKLRTEFERMARARLASGKLEHGVVVLSMLSWSSRTKFARALFDQARGR